MEFHVLVDCGACFQHVPVPALTNREQSVVCTRCNSRMTFSMPFDYEPPDGWELVEKGGSAKARIDRLERKLVRLVMAVKSRRTRKVPILATRRRRKVSKGRRAR